MNEVLMQNAYATSTVIAYSQPIRMGDANALSISVTVVTGTTAAATALVVELSNDGINWTATTSGTTWDSKAAPNQVIGNVTSVTARMARIKITGAASGVIVNVAASPYRT